MSLFGKHIMQAVVLILESDNNADVKEQALCILANIADGDNAKSFIMANEDVLKKITSYLMHNNTKLQMAAVVCIYNLAYIEESGAGERQARLREVGVHKILGQLLAASDQSLSEKWVFLKGIIAILLIYFVFVLLFLSIFTNFSFVHFFPDFLNFPILVCPFFSFFSNFFDFLIISRG